MKTQLFNLNETQLYVSFGLTVLTLIIGILISSGKTPEDKKNFEIMFPLVLFFFFNLHRTYLQIIDFGTLVAGKENGHLINDVTQILYFGAMILMLFFSLHSSLKNDNGNRFNMKVQ